MTSNLRNFYISSLSFLKFLPGSETLSKCQMFRIQIGVVMIGSGFSNSLYPDLESAKWLNTDPESVNPDPESVYPDPESVYPDPESVYPDPESVNTDPVSVNADPESVNPDPKHW
jgi:hypothetical protein